MLTCSVARASGYHNECMLESALTSWPFDPWLLASLVLAAWIYLRGWRVYHRRDPSRWPVAKLILFASTLLTIYVSLASPIEPFASLLLWAHMVQHLLLTMLAPPLFWLAAPLLPMIRGLPAPIRTYWIAPLFRVHWLRKLFATLTHPIVAMLLFILATWLWHVPQLYELALRSQNWHYLQHICFLTAGLLFWYPVVRPYPFQPQWPLWLLFPMLLIADVSNTVLSALLTFSDRVIYPHYEQVPRLGFSALDDQAAAGVLMWVPGSIAFLVPLSAIGLRFLFGTPALPRSRSVPKNTRIALPLAETHFDLLRVPIAGSFLKWKHSRIALQLPLFMLAILVAVDGFSGSRIAPMNLAGVLPWIHWRGLLIITLLVAGNFFCTDCPFTLPRALASRWLPVGRAWPRRLRSKWLAMTLLVGFFTAYEALALWDRPWLTAAIIVGYFAAAFAVDAVFRGASFCKYVCPIGQFNFVQSLASPLEVQARDEKVCSTCMTKDCLKACGTSLNVPKKQSNMDCTFCLDCVHACPHDNLGIVARRTAPAMRLDLAALIAVLAFAAFANAAGMVGPVLDAQVTVQKSLGLASLLPVVIGFNLVAMVLLPGIVVYLARRSPRAVLTLVPIGFAMWLAHYGFHLATSYETAWPVMQQFLGVGTPAWQCSCCCDVGSWLLKTEIIILDVGLLASLYVAHRTTSTLRELFPWLVLVLVLFGLGLWIVHQPMDMRGTMT